MLRREERVGAMSPFDRMRETIRREAVATGLREAVIARLLLVVATRALQAPGDQRADLFSALRCMLRNVAACKDSYDRYEAGLNVGEFWERIAEDEALWVRPALREPRKRRTRKAAGDDIEPWL